MYIIIRNHYPSVLQEFIKIYAIRLKRIGHRSIFQSVILSVNIFLLANMPMIQEMDAAAVPVTQQNRVDGKLEVPATPLSDIDASTKSADGMPKEAPIQSNVRSLISERSIDEARPLKLIYIGAGVSGIAGAIEFMKRLPNLELVIYEKNPEVGGTWFENRYPGCACGEKRLLVTSVRFINFITNKAFSRRTVPFVPAELRILAEMEELLRRCSGNSRILEACDCQI